MTSPGRAERELQKTDVVDVSCSATRLTLRIKSSEAWCTMSLGCYFLVCLTQRLGLSGPSIKVLLND